MRGTRCLRSTRGNTTRLMISLQPFPPMSGAQGRAGAAHRAGASPWASDGVASHRGAPRRARSATHEQVRASGVRLHESDGRAPGTHDEAVTSGDASQLLAPRAPRRRGRVRAARRTRHDGRRAGLSNHLGSESRGHRGQGGCARLLQQCRRGRAVELRRPSGSRPRTRRSPRHGCERSIASSSRSSRQSAAIVSGSSRTPELPRRDRHPAPLRRSGRSIIACHRGMSFRANSGGAFPAERPSGRRREEAA
jgi:hypothetical protein